MADTRSYPVDFAPGPSSSDALNNLPRGCIGGKERSSNESNIDGTAVVLSYNFTVSEDGRRQRITAKVTLKSETAGTVSARLRIDSTQIDRVNDDATGAGKFVSFAWSKDVELDAGTYTVDLVCGRGGSGSNLVT